MQGIYKIIRRLGNQQILRGIWRLCGCVNQIGMLVFVVLNKFQIRFFFRFKVGSYIQFMSQVFVRNLVVSGGKAVFFEQFWGWVYISILIYNFVFIELLCNFIIVYIYIINIYELGVNILNVGILLKRREDWMLKSIK